MRLHGINMDGQEDPLPETVLVEMTMAEAQWIVRETGKTTGEDVTAELYSQLSNVFNSFWDSGVDSYRR